MHQHLSRLSAGSLEAYVRELEEVKEENHALYTTLSTVEDTLRKYLDKLTMKQKNELLEEVAGGKVRPCPLMYMPAEQCRCFMIMRDSYYVVWIPQSYFRNANKYVQESYTFWSSDFHISPIADLKDLFQPMGMKVRLDWH